MMPAQLQEGDVASQFQQRAEERKNGSIPLSQDLQTAQGLPRLADQEQSPRNRGATVAQQLAKRLTQQPKLAASDNILNQPFGGSHRQIGEIAGFRSSSRKPFLEASNPPGAKVEPAGAAGMNADFETRIPMTSSLNINSRSYAMAGGIPGKKQDRAKEAAGPGRRPQAAEELVEQDKLLAASVDSFLEEAGESRQKEAQSLFQGEPSRDETLAQASELEAYRAPLEREQRLLAESSMPNLPASVRIFDNDILAGSQQGRPYENEAEDYNCKESSGRGANVMDADIQRNSGAYAAEQQENARLPLALENFCVQLTSSEAEPGVHGYNVLGLANAASRNPPLGTINRSQTQASHRYAQNQMSSTLSKLQDSRLTTLQSSVLPPLQQ